MARGPAPGPGRGGTPIAVGRGRDAGRRDPTRPRRPRYTSFSVTTFFIPYKQHASRPGQRPALGRAGRAQSARPRPSDPRQNRQRPSRGRTAGWWGAAGGVVLGGAAPAEEVEERTPSVNGSREVEGWAETRGRGGSESGIDGARGDDGRVRASTADLERGREEVDVHLRHRGVEPHGGGCLCGDEGGRTRRLGVPT